MSLNPFVKLPQMCLIPLEESLSPVKVKYQISDIIYNLEHYGVKIDMPYQDAKH